MQWKSKILKESAIEEDGSRESNIFVSKQAQ
jgi:hypothetical protein